MSPQWLIAVISAVAALMSAVGSLYWGRDARQAAAREVQAKNAELQAKDALISNLERLSPKRLVDDVHALMELQEQLLVAARQQAELQAQEKLAAFEKASGAEKNQLEAELQASRERITELQTIEAESEAINRRMVWVGGDWLEEQDLRLQSDLRASIAWMSALNDLPPKLKAVFREGTPRLEGNRLILAIPYEYHNKVAHENLDKLIPVVREKFGLPTLDIDVVPPQGLHRKA